MWTKIPTALTLPATPDTEQSAYGAIWRSSADGCFCFNVRSTSQYVIAARPVVSVVLDSIPWGSADTTLLPQFSEVNGYIWWASTSGMLYHAPTGISSTLWLLVPPVFPLGAMPYADKDSSDVWHGDGWYESSSLFYQGLTPKGTRLNVSSASITATKSWGAHWTRSGSMGGVYSPQGGASGDRGFGCPYWQGRLGRTTYSFVRSLEQTGGYYRYVPTVSGVNPIEHVTAEGGSWQWDAPNGSTYRSADEPSLSAPVSFSPVSGSGSAVVLTFTGYSAGSETVDVLVGDVCRFL